MLVQQSWYLGPSGKSTDNSNPKQFLLDFSMLEQGQNADTPRTLKFLPNLNMHPIGNNFAWSPNNKKKPFSRIYHQTQPFK